MAGNIVNRLKKLEEATGAGGTVPEWSVAAARVELDTFTSLDDGAAPTDEQVQARARELTERFRTEKVYRDFPHHETALEELEQA